MTDLINNNSSSCPEILLAHEIEFLLSYAKQSSVRDYTMIALALGTGLRNSEICGLNVENVYAYKVVPTVLELPAKISKGGRGRNIPLTTDLRDILTLYLNIMNGIDKLLLQDDPLFISKYTHNRLNPRDFQRIVNNYSSKSLSRKIHPHTLRHTFATRLLSVSNLRIVQKVLGHKNIQNTQIYTHPSTSDVSEAMNSMK